MMNYDVIVVGAGPAGSTTARECAARGLSVLLLDKAIFPRDKPCGGGVNLRAARLLPFDLAPITERVAFRMRFSRRQMGGFIRSSPEPLTYLTQRRHLDAFLLDRALDADVTFQQGVSVRAVERQPTQVIVHAGEQRFQGRTLVAADGTNGRTAKLAGVPLPRWQLVALEGNITPPGDVLHNWDDALGVDFGDMPGGYGWLFPKRDHLNLGVIGWPQVGPSLRACLDRLIRFYGFDPASLWGLRGYRLPICRPGAPLVDGNIVLVGDAAGLVEPMSGEGIYAAIWSGCAAAPHLAAYLAEQVPDLTGYQRTVEHDLLPELNLARRFGDFLGLAPTACMVMMQHAPGVWEAFCGIVRGDQTFAEVRRKLGPLAHGIDLISSVARVMPRYYR
jgi:geranylgeranyl reductase family protein